MRNTDQTKKIDAIVGARIKELRLTLGLSRAQVARKLSITHQQLQKYEKGANRISIGRLVLICKLFNRPISYFIDEEAMVIPNQHQRMCIEVSRNFMQIKNPVHQRSVNILVKSLVG